MPAPLAAGERGVQLTPVDLAWLRMDEPANLMHIHVVFVIAGGVTRDEVMRVFLDRLANVPRFRQRVARDGGDFVWVEDRDFDIGRHVLEEPLPGPGGDAELAAALAEHLGKAFDRRHPLWQFHCLQGYRGNDTVLFGRLHHSIGDGIAMMVVLLALTDVGRRGPATVDAEEAASGSLVNPFLELLQAGPGAALEAAKAAAERWMPETLRLMLAPVEAFSRLNPFAKGAGATVALGRLVGRVPDPRTVFKGTLSVPKRLAWTEPLSLDTVRGASKALGVSINDLLNNSMAGGLRRYLARQGTPPEGLSFRAAMPVNLRPLDQMWQLGNRFGLIFLSLPVGIADPLRRLEEIRRRSAALRRSAEPLLVLGLLDIAGRSPAAVQRLLVKIFGSKATAVFTNVPGPRQTLWFGGKAIRDIFFWVPQAGHLGLGVSIFSYDGKVRMGVGTDAGLVPDPERIVDGFRAEFDALLTAASRS